MSSLTSGLRIGSYQLESLIGKTGMSEVWRAKTYDGKTVALKTISREAGEDPQMRARFLREGGEHQLLKHPSIVPIIDFFEQNGTSYLVMRYLTGGSLEDRLEAVGWNKPLPIPEALSIARQILPALDFAHQHAIIHRDVKPSNILLEDGKAFLGDFGIALALNRPRLTSVKQIIGTRRYMSPEQIRTPLEITHLTDVYSFGCVLYEMLTGRQPYDQGSETEEAQYAMLARREQEPPKSLREWNPEVPMRLERIVLTSLSPVPHDRFAGCGSFCGALDGVENESTTITVPPVYKADPPRPEPETVKNTGTTSSRKPLSVAGNVTFAVLAALAWLPFVGQSQQNVTMIAIACFMVSNVLFFRMLYKAWESLPTADARTTPGKAAGLLLIPFFNLYWCWQSVSGFASDYGKYLARCGLTKPKQPAPLYAAFCICYFYLPTLLMFTNQPAAGQVALFDFMVFIPAMIGVLAHAANATKAGANTAEQAAQ